MFLPHKCGAWWTQVWSKCRTCVEDARDLCGANTRFLLFFAGFLGADS